MQAYYLQILDKSYAIAVSSPEDFMTRLVEKMGNAAREQKTLDTKITYLGQEFFLRDMVKINRRANAKSQYLYATVSEEGKINQFWVLDRKNFKFSLKVPTKLESILEPQMALSKHIQDISIGEIVWFSQLMESFPHKDKATFFDELHFVMKSNMMMPMYKVNPNLNLEVEDKWTPQPMLGMSFKHKETKAEHQVGLADVLVALMRI